MRFTEARQGRIFIIRLEDGEIIHQAVESFAREHNIRAAMLIALGGADGGSTIVSGPKGDRELPVAPIINLLQNAHEAVGTGTLFPDEQGNPILHMHMAFGRNEKTSTGCIRSGVKVWHVLEIILIELLDTQTIRKAEPPTNMKLLDPR